MAIDMTDSTLAVLSPSDDVHNLTSLTMMAWVRLDSTPRTSAFVEINKPAPFPSYRKALGFLNSGGSSEMLMLVVHSGSNAEARADAPSSGVWHHLCGRWSEGEAPDLFVDGADVTSGSGIQGSGTLLTDEGTISLHIEPTCAPINGRLADVAIFNRTLSDAEIACIARGRLRAMHLDPVWHVTLEGSEGTAAVGDIGLRDTTGRGNHLNGIGNPPSYDRDPPLHWPSAIDVGSRVPRWTHNSRQTMDVTPGTKRATMRRGR